MGVTVHLNLSQVTKMPGRVQLVEKVGSYTVLTSSMNYATTKQAFLKRAMDIAGGLVGCLICGVLFIFVAPVLYISSPGPIFFTQERIGKNGKHFKMYKFRSMYMDAEARKQELMAQNRHGGNLMFKLEFDPRIIGNKILPDGTRKTGIGQFIRDTSIDEFPQFFNVLKGELSLVGTRPPTVDEWEKYKFHHRARLAIKPGITGLWQISGRSNITDFEEVVALDKKYIREWSMGLDLRIMVKTVKVVLGKEGSM
jgi:lipopolysaccharide/colanic/teichoic acid biosynthesis glycosyltransferase